MYEKSTVSDECWKKSCQYTATDIYAKDKVRNDANCGILRLRVSYFNVGVNCYTLD